MQSNEVADERIRAGRVVRRIGKREDVLVRAHRKSLNLAEFGILQFVTQNAKEMLPAGIVVGKGHP